MLRWIAVLVVVLNIIYFAVNFGADKPVETVVINTSTSSAPVLVMLGEKPSALEGSASSKSEKKSASGLSEDQMLNNSSVVNSPASSPEFVAAQSSDNKAVVSKDSGAVPVVTFPVPDVANGGEQKPSPDSPTNDVANKNASVVAASESCWEVGKLDDEAQGKQLAARLAALGQSMTLQKKAVQGEPDYWVFLGPYANRRQALASHRDMQARKIDSFLINEGELENAVSLGLFSRRAGAESMQQDRKKQGLDARLRAVPRLRNEWWGVLKHPAEQLPNEMREIILAQKTGSALEIKALDCESIANTEKLD